MCYLAFYINILVLSSLLFLFVEIDHMDTHNVNSYVDTHSVINYTDTYNVISYTDTHTVIDYADTYSVTNTTSGK